MALLHITDASGRRWQCPLSPQTVCTIGRAPDNTVVLNDPRASRYHAHVRHDGANYLIIDGKVGGGRSANHVFVRGERREEHALADGDRVQVGASELRFDLSDEARAGSTAEVRFDERPLGHTQVRLSANDVMRSLQPKPLTGALVGVTGEEVKALRRKADMLSLLYEMSKTLGAVFRLDSIFDKATEVIFSATPADRVVALLRTQGVHAAPAPGADGDGDDELEVVSLRVRDERRGEQARSQPIGRTITRKVMRERAALLSQDVAADERFAGVHSIVTQGVRSTICAPLLVESNVHGALYADRLDPLTTFTRDDLELVSAVAAQAAVAVENARSHERLAREEVARANYKRFLPEYVVRQLLEDPGSFKLGGANQTVTVLFADIRGFTSISEHAPPEQIVRLLNEYFSAMTEIIFEHGGTLDKYIGDELMALFGAPTATPDDACHAVTAAVRMQREVPRINETLRAEGLPEIEVGIGLHTGEATVGYIGSERRSEFTAIGDTVNLAARLQSNARGGQIFISEATARAATEIDCPLVPHPAISVKNRTQPVPIFEVEWRQERSLRAEG